MVATREWRPKITGGSALYAGIRSADVGTSRGRDIVPFVESTCWSDVGFTVDSGKQALRIETEFLSGAEANIERAKGSHLRGSIWRIVRDDDAESLRAYMATNRNYDRDLLKQLPHNRRLEVQGYERTWWLGRKQTGKAIASVLCPLDHWAKVEPGDAPPIDLDAVQDHLRKIVKETKVPVLVGVCSPSGFTEAARNWEPDGNNVTLVLSEPDGHGGWKGEHRVRRCPGVRGQAVRSGVRAGQNRPGVGSHRRAQRGHVDRRFVGKFAVGQAGDTRAAGPRGLREGGGAGCRIEIVKEVG